MADEWKPEGARELAADEWRPEGARPLEAAPVAPAAPAQLKQTPLDIGAGATFGSHFARHLSFGLGDKVIAAIQTAEELAGDKSGKHSWAETYRRNLAFNDKALEDSDAAHPVARWAGNTAGVAGSILAPIGAARLAQAGTLGRAAQVAAVASAAAKPTLGQLSAQGAKTGAVLGGLGGYGNSRADDAAGTALDTGAGIMGGATLGAGAPVLARGVGRAASYLGDKAQDLGGWLKVNSLHPTPTLGEAMEELPGGRVGVGRELLKRNLGGITQHGTAAQIAKASKQANADIAGVARAYDASGGAPLDLTGAVDQSLQHAAELNQDPLTREAGNKLAGVAGEYRQTYGTPTSALEALALKRRIGDSAYSHTISGEPVAGQYGAGLAKLERGVDSSMDAALGPDFEAANVASRRLSKAQKAAELSAARTHSNHLLGGLMSTVAAGAGFAHGGAHEALPLAMGSLLFSKYGSQAGARAAYGLGQGLEMGGAALGNSFAPSATETLRESLTPDLSRLLQQHPEMAAQFAQAEALRRRNGNTLNLEASP